MSLPVFQALKRLAMGDSQLPRQVTVGMHDPQSEVTVWLHGLAEPHDVTDRHVLACVEPLTIGVVFDPAWKTPANDDLKLSLRFKERHGGQRLLGEIRLRGAGVTADPSGLRLFGIRGSTNYC